MLTCKYKHWPSFSSFKKTHKLLLTIHFTCDDILKIIKNVDQNKAHDYGVISTWMIKICNASICKLL